MGSIQARFTDGPANYEAVEALSGGFVVEARAGGVEALPACGIAVDASKKVVGVAQKDAAVHPGNAVPRSPVAGVLDMTMAPFEVAVINNGFVPLKYAAACAYGARICSAGAGSVRPWVSGDGADAIIGWCREKGGVALGGTGLSRINV